MSGILRVVDRDFVHWCPGCERLHMLPKRWHFNKNLEKPTFDPSFKHTVSGSPPYICHYNIIDGKIHYHDDSEHHLKGMTMEMPSIPEAIAIGDVWTGPRNADYSVRVG